MKFKQISVLAVILLFLSAFLSSSIPVAAESVGVTVRFGVAAEKGITVSLPANATNSYIFFDILTQNFTEIGADGQTDSIAAANVSNDGNTAISIDGNFSSNLPTGVTYVNVSVGDNTNTSKFSYTQATDLDAQEIEDSIAIGGYQLFWFWASGNEVAAGTHDVKFTFTSDTA